MRKQKYNHPKAEAAKQRKTAQKTVASLAIEKERMDAYWQDEDKLSQRKLQRKSDKEAKRLDDISKKAELKRLAAEDNQLMDSQIKPKGKSNPEKVTQAQIQANITSATPKQPVAIVTDIPLQENYNHTINRLDPGSGDARSIDQAIHVLNGANYEATDKRSQVGYITFEREHLPLLRQAHPSLRLAQVRQLVWKEWERSPENPNRST
ncbi:coiled-coil domain-containing protein [Oopsacas minuta]|uniref:Coiled-coil domain-containing protein n=1 Tax=Oopsacas minuta TaxID=111878 RepID=A0AAV7KJB2_9METZ|nr:coiled-coil domain-containing protein [Oopsacas minuta]